MAAKILKTMILSLGLSHNLSMAAETVTWKSIYTDTDTECVVWANSNQKAEIDFSKRECKSFGGYQLFIEGADLRYSPTLEFNGKAVFSHREYAFHNLNSTKIEWVYLQHEDETGRGRIEWKGFIFRLAVAREDGGPDASKLYAVRLNGNKTCFLGEAKNNEDARNLVKNSQARCEIIR